MSMFSVVVAGAAGVWRLKFKRRVAPGDALILRLERRDVEEGPRVRFQLTRDDAPCCTGELRFIGTGAREGE